MAEKQLLDWHCANLEYGCAAHLDLVALKEWDQDDQFEFHGEHCMLEKGYVRSLRDGAKWSEPESRRAGEPESRRVFEFFSISSQHLKMI
jgi:hypothetical protein